MATSTEFTLSGDSDEAMLVVARALTEAGFQIANVSDGWSKVSRGSMGKTVVMGALAGKNMHVRFLMATGRDVDGRTLVRFDRDLAVSMLKGGAIGAARTSTIYGETVDLIGRATSQAGIYLGVRALA